MSLTRIPLAAHCHACGHVWAIAWLPIPAASIPTKYACPLCFEKKRIFLAAASDAAKIPQPLICEVPHGG